MKWDNSVVVHKGANSITKWCEGNTKETIFTDLVVTSLIPLAINKRVTKIIIVRALSLLLIEMVQNFTFDLRLVTIMIHSFISSKVVEFFHQKWRCLICKFHFWKLIQSQPSLSKATYNCNINKTNFKRPQDYKH